jgi:hypothetical protein
MQDQRSPIDGLTEYQRFTGFEAEESALDRFWDKFGNQLITLFLTKNIDNLSKYQ